MHLYELFAHCPSPASTCIVFNNGNAQCIFTYNDLRENVRQISSLLNSFSVSGTVVCFLIKSSHVIPAVILGTLKLSIPFAFLDVRDPCTALKNFQQYIPVDTLLIEEEFLKDLNCKLCSCWQKVSTQVVFKSTVVILQSHKCLNEQCDKTKKCLKNFHTYSSDIAYVIQTSGTTGQPKIVQVPHQCIVPNILDFKSRFNVVPEDVILQCSRITFDPSIIEIFLALSSGCTLFMISDNVRAVPSKLAEVIQNSKITILQATPSLIQTLGDDFVKNELLCSQSNLRILAFGGEICPTRNKLKRWKSSENSTQIYNLYGITEVSCWATCFKIDLDFDNGEFRSCIPLGDPLCDTELEIRKNGENSAQDGELYIGGSVRWCMVNDEVWPSTGTPLFRSTGDIVYKSKNGTIYFEGRNDNIVKCKGHKLSLQKVNDILESLTEISYHFLHFDHEICKLYLFLVSSAGKCDLLSEFRHNLMEKLRHAVPNLPATEIAFVPFIPLTLHGKADYRKLLEIANTKRENANLNENFYNKYLDEFVSTMWKKYTNQDDILKSDNFILKSGDSFMAVQFASDIEWELQTTFPLLVEKLLNESFNEVLAHVKMHLGDKEKYSKLLNISITSEDESQYVTNEPAQKKKRCDYLNCYYIATRRGKFLVCEHGEHCLFKPPECMSNPTNEFSLNFKSKWDLKKCVDASPCLTYFLQSNQFLAFIGSHSGIFICVNIENGSVIWKITLPDRIESSACISSCGNYVLVGCYDHHLYIFDISNGNIKWRMKAEAEIKSSPCVSSQNLAFVGSHDKHLYAVKIETGDILWKKKISNGSIFSSPAVSETHHAVCAATLDGVLAMINMNSGAFIWTYNYGKPIFSSPLVTSNSVLVGSTNGHMLHFDLLGNIMSTYVCDGPIFSSVSLASSENTNFVFGCHDSFVHCITPDGKCLWKTCCDASIYSTPFIFDWKNENYVAVACTSGKLYILDQKGGKVVKQWQCPGEVFSSPVFLYGFLIFGCRDNYVYCFSI